MTDRNPAPESGKQESPAWRWILPLVILAGILAYMLKTCSVPPPAKAPVEKAPIESGDMPGKLGKFSASKLPNGIELNLPEFGVERKLIAFIEDASKPVDKTTWFSFDRLEFETGSATLKADSAEQLKNVAEILKAYPKVALKIGGYTDNVGDPSANRKLSQARAANTMNELVKLGIDAKRLEAEGYGDMHPVADNATEEGRQKNRRIDLRVTAK
jgi:outer membrane protein OmpA-like peptidoglycan-associated protein